MYLKYILAICLLSSSLSFAQFPNGIPGDTRGNIQSTIPEFEIRSILISIELGIQQNNYLYMDKYLAQNLTPKAAGSEFVDYLNPLIKFENIQLNINGNQASVDCIVVNQLTSERTPEHMVLSREKGQWRITESKLVKEYIAFAKNTQSIETNKIGDNNSKDGTISTQTLNLQENSIVASNFQFVNSLIFSNTALLQRSVYGTELVKISQDVTYSTIGKFLFNSPVDGNIANIQNTDYTLSIIADSAWGRIIYGNSKGNWLKSYGDNSGEQRLPWVSSTGADKFGNIFALAGFPTKVVQMKYETASEKITFVKNIPLPGVIQATDMCLAPNSTPDDISDDSFWITDRKSNAIFEFSYNGQLRGKYTKLRNLLTGEEVNFIRPSKISVIQVYEVAPLCVIDFDNKRIILVNNIDGYDGETINCSFVAVRFADQTKVSLKSISDFGVFNSAIWASDPGNKMFHLFSPRSGYLASVQSLENGNNQWSHPTNLLHASQSNSPMGPYLAGVVFDGWDNTGGMSLYYEGSDIIDPTINHRIEGDVPVVGVSGTLITSSVLSLEVRDDWYNTLIKSIDIPAERWSGTQSLCTLLGTDFSTYYRNKILTARFYFSPAYSTCYGSDDVPYDQHLYKEIEFAFPPTATMVWTRIGLIVPNVDIELVMNSGSGSYEYQWYRQDWGSNTWSKTTKFDFARQNGEKSFYIKCDILDRFSNITLSMPPKFISSQTLSGTLTTDEIWSKDEKTGFAGINLTGNVIVPAGLTLTIDPGVIVAIPNNTSITVYGTLKANKNQFIFSGTGRTGKVIFDGNSSSASIMDQNIVANAAQIECKNGANVLIQNCTIMNCTNGIYIYNSAPRIIGNNITEPYNNGIYGDASGKSPLIKDNIIKKIMNNYLHYQGIYLMTLTNPFITGNDISGFDFGIYYGGGGTGMLTDNNNATPTKNNRLTGNRIGLTVAWSSYLTAGIPSYPFQQGARNSIWGNSAYDATAYKNGTIIAYYNWWGADGTQVYSYSDGKIYATLPLTSDPWASSPLIYTNRLTSDLNSSDIVVDSSIQDILIGLQLEKDTKGEEAIDHYKKMIDRNSHPQFAISSIVKLKSKLNKEEVKEYLSDYSPNKNSRMDNRRDKIKYEAMNYYAGMLLDEDRIDEAFSVLDHIAQNSKDRNEELNALFGKFYAALNLKKDKPLAGEILNIIGSLSYKDDDFLHRKETAEYLYKLNGDGGKSFYKSTALTDVDNVKEYALLGNYPNPFNPSTNISYTLPYESSVQLIIYDILGREVRNFLIPSQSTGKQVILWDGKNSNGSNVGSGVYIYRLILKSLENDEKFVKTAKLMMLK